jgi:crotonobetainyl-CoA:carnitine CoA-transferase CaiB-like acyl-CoA transferase
MMGGLAYMTGPPGRPLRAGSSVIDVTGGMFGVIGILAALMERHQTGVGRTVTSALFETTAYLVGQHMAQQAVTGKPAQPMPVRLSAWAIYDVFQTKDSEQVFVGIVSDTQWRQFCKDFGLAALDTPDYATNRQRVAARDTLLPRVRELFAGISRATLIERLEQSGLPFAPIGRPEDLFTDPHLTASGGLQTVILADGRETRLPVMPLAWDGERLQAASALPSIGEHTREILSSVGLGTDEIESLRQDGVIRGA